VVFVLCLTCVNVATLELVRSSGRRTELAVLAAFGADQRRIVLSAVIEGVMQAVAGGAIGLALSAATVEVLRSLIPAAFGGDSGDHLSWGIAAGAALTILACAAASAVFPIVASLGTDVQSALRGRDAATTRGVALIRRALIVVQISFACILVYGAALMIATVRAAQTVSLGFQPEGLVTFKLSLPRESYPDPPVVTATFQSLATTLRALPGVTQVGIATNVPLDADVRNTLLAVEGRPFLADGTDPDADFRVVSAGYFEAMGMRVLAGRGFQDGDGYLAGTPVVISRTLALRLWPDGADPVGHRIRTGPYVPWMTIIGVVSDTKNRSLTLPSHAELYLPFDAPRSPVGISRDMAFVVRAASDAAATSVQAAAQRAVLATSPDLPLYAKRSYTDVVSASRVREVATMRTLTGFALVALALAIAGSYAMLMFAVVQRRRELAVRQALGARPGDLVILIGREMGELLLVGAGTGMMGAILLSRALSRFLFGVSALDPRVMAGTLFVVALAGLGAAVVPARRAALVDPMLVLRE
jgi:predicted permease